MERQQRHARAARRAHAISPLSSRILGSASGQPLFQGSTFGEEHRPPELAAAPTIASRSARRQLDRAALDDVVDPALHDQVTSVPSTAVVEPRADLVGPLAADAHVPEDDARVGRGGPVEVLARLVVAGILEQPPLGIRSQPGLPAVIESPRPVTTIRSRSAPSVQPGVELHLDEHAGGM